MRVVTGDMLHLNLGCVDGGYLLTNLFGLLLIWLWLRFNFSLCKRFLDWTDWFVLPFLNTSIYLSWDERLIVTRSTSSHQFQSSQGVEASVTGRQGVHSKHQVVPRSLSYSLQRSWLREMINGRSSKVDSWQLNLSWSYFLDIIQYQQKCRLGKTLTSKDKSIWSRDQRLVLLCCTASLNDEVTFVTCCGTGDAHIIWQTTGINKS